MGKEDFYQHTADLNTRLTQLKSRVSESVNEMANAQKQGLQEAEQDLKRIPEWVELTQEEQNNALDQLTALTRSASNDLVGLEKLITHEFDIQSSLSELKQRIIREGRERQRQRVEEQKKKDIKDGKTKVERSIKIPVSLSTTAQLEELIKQLQSLKSELSYYDEFELKIEQQD